MSNGMIRYKIKYDKELFQYCVYNMRKNRIVYTSISLVSAIRYVRRMLNIKTRRKIPKKRLLVKIVK